MTKFIELTNLNGSFLVNTSTIHGVSQLEPNYSGYRCRIIYKSDSIEVFDSFEEIKQKLNIFTEVKCSII